LSNHHSSTFVCEISETLRLIVVYQPFRPQKQTNEDRGENIRAFVVREVDIFRIFVVFLTSQSLLMDSEKLTPGDDIELVVDKEGFPLTVEQISTLMDSKSTQLLEQLGGINMVALALKTDLKNGLSEEEQKTDFAARRAVYLTPKFHKPTRFQNFDAIF
jgi:hypothetical protein